jgi:hypothetical protein
MKKCIAYIADPSSAHAWRPCRKPARLKSSFCRQHETIAVGVMLGLCVYGFRNESHARRKTSLSEMPVASRVPS